MLQPAGSSRAASVGSGSASLSRQPSAQPPQGGCLSPSAPATPQQQGEAAAAPAQQEDEAPPTRAAAMGAADAGHAAEPSARGLSASPAVAEVSPVAPTTPSMATAPAAAARDGQQVQVAPQGSSKNGIEAGSPPCSSPARLSAPRPVQPLHSPSPDPIAEQARLCSDLIDCACALVHACACSASHSSCRAARALGSGCRHAMARILQARRQVCKVLTLTFRTGISSCLELHKP